MPTETLRACFENPERGCAVLDQPQHDPQFRPFVHFSTAAAGLRHSLAPFLKHALSRTVLFGALILGAAVHKTDAVGKVGSYEAIINRNAFHLNSLSIGPPLIPDPVNTIKLIGVSSVGGRRKVFLQITKPGRGKETLKPILEEGQSEAEVEVLKINAEQGWVRVKNGGKDMTLTFENMSRGPK